MFADVFHRWIALISFAKIGLDVPYSGPAGVTVIMYVTAIHHVHEPAGSQKAEDQ
jgi:hypothetical protein